MTRSATLCAVLFTGIGLAAFLVASLAVPAAGAPLAGVQTILVVDTLEDENNADGDCSLREAVHAANANIPVDACTGGDGVGVDTITFSVSGTLTVSTQLAVYAGGPLVIDGGGAITVSGGDKIQVFYMDTGSDLTLSSLTIAHGQVEYGGGIYKWGGTLTITNSVVTDNHAGKWGGGIYNNAGDVSILNSSLSNNSAGLSGGGVYNCYSSCVMTITNSILSGNSAGDYGGGGIDNTGWMTILSSTLSANTAAAGGGIDNHGTLTVTNSTFVGNHAESSGGGIYNGAELNLLNSTLSGNISDGSGGGLSTNVLGFYGNSSVRNSTLSGNHANDLGGGIAHGVYPIYGVPMIISNSIVSGNSASQSGNCAGSLVLDYGYNLEDTDTCGFDPALGSLPNTDPQLGPLQDNGGPTWTHALLSSSSPAVDAGDPVDCSLTDQRGVARPIDGDKDGAAICDIGAFEFDPAARPFRAFLPYTSH